MNSSEQQLGFILTNQWWEHLDHFINQALAEDPSSSLAVACKGFVCLRQGDAQAAQALFLNSLAIDPTDSVARSGLFCFHFQEANFTEADDLLKGLLREFPEHEGVHIARCTLYAKFRDRARATQAISEALCIYPESEPIRSIELYHAYHGKDAAKTVELSTEILKISPENALAHLILGWDRLTAKEFDQAEYHLRTCMRINPDENTARMLQLLENTRDGNASWKLGFWAYRRRISRLFFRKRFLLERLQMKWRR
jgi:tetratricopeptide (TPR) repeat protein